MNLTFIGSESDPNDLALQTVIAFIAQGDLKDGDRLPPERELAQELGISRRALRQALAQMELNGQVWRGKRNGTVLGRQAPPTATAGVDRSLARASPGDVMEARLTLEPVLAGVAAAKATAAELKKIENYARRTAEAADDESWSRWDGEFHRAIAEATHNEIFEVLIAAFNSARTQPKWRSMRVALVTPEMRRATVAHHRAIAEALSQRQPDAASLAMRRHLLAVRDHLFT